MVEPHDRPSGTDQRGHDPMCAGQELLGVPAAANKIVDFESLAEGGKVVVIEFNGQHYRLRQTKMGRLVLTK